MLLQPLELLVHLVIDFISENLSFFPLLVDCSDFFIRRLLIQLIIPEFQWNNATEEILCVQFNLLVNIYSRSLQGFECRLHQSENILPTICDSKLMSSSSRFIVTTRRETPLNHLVLYSSILVKAASTKIHGNLICNCTSIPTMKDVILLDLIFQIAVEKIKKFSIIKEIFFFCP